MRTRIGLPLAAVCLGLLGCATPPGPKQTSPDGPGTPFTGAKLTKPVRDPSAPPPEADVLLAGQVVEKAFGKRVANASIQVVDLEDTSGAPAARLDFTANADGYFFIPGLQSGHHYQLIARVKDADHLLSGMTLATPPNPRLSIYISEDLTTPSTPAPLSPPTPPPARAPADKDANPPPADPTPPKAAPGPGAAAPATPPLNRIADRTESGGFPRMPVSPPAAIPNVKPNPVLPPPPSFAPAAPTAPAPSDSPPSDSPPAQQTRQDGPAARGAPPFCVLEGNRLDNFSLPTLDGQAWEFRRDPPRKLVLVDFWKTNCAPCRAAIPHLVRLQDAYGRDGLEVVGIAYEDEAAPAQQAMNVRQARSQYHINYTILMGADSRGGACPVRSQFMVDSFPRLVLIDETGDILWRSDPRVSVGDQLAELKRQIEHKLYAK